MEVAGDFCGIHHFTSLVDFIFREATGAGWATAPVVLVYVNRLLST
jgi:hypothetical protein